MSNIMSAIHSVIEPNKINGFYRVRTSVNGIDYDEQLGIQVNDKSIKSNNKFIVAYTVGSQGGIQANIGAELVLGSRESGSLEMYFTSTNFPFSFDAMSAAALAYISNNVIESDKLLGKFTPKDGIIKYMYGVKLSGDTVSSYEDITQTFKTIMPCCLLSSAVITGFLTDKMSLKYDFNFHKDDITKIENLIR